MDTAQLLRDMGIDVWRVRSAPTASARTAQPAPAGPPERVAPPVAREARPATPRPAADVAAPFSVICAQTDTALILAEGVHTRPAQRFVRDVLRSLGDGEVRTLAFEWPQAGLEPTTSSAVRALRSFCTRQLDESGDAIVLLGAEVLKRAGDLPMPEGVVVLAPLDTLMTSATEKRKLWQALRQCRTRLQTGE